MTTYLHQRPDWPKFRWDDSAVSLLLSNTHAQRVALLAEMRRLGFEFRQETVLDVLVQDVQKSSEIEGERLDPAQVRSSVARKLGMDTGGLPLPDRHVDGVVAMVLDATQRFQEPLTANRLFVWHTGLFPTGYSGLSRIASGAWRDDALGPMHVVSGPMGKERIHYEAPLADRLNDEMAAFLSWFEQAEIDPLLRAAIAHLWFVTIHPFDDGNGRIGRAIMDMALARADQSRQRFYSVSTQIQKDQRGYYDVLERTQKASLDVTQWVQWFLECLDQALQAAQFVLELVQTKTNFWESHVGVELNDRQRKILNMLLDGFHGKLQTAKYAKIVKCSNDTALRDLTDLVAKGILRRDESGGRSTSYLLE
jgi:Fic family protein